MASVEFQRLRESVQSRLELNCRVFRNPDSRIFNTVTEKKPKTRPSISTKLSWHAAQKPETPPEGSLYQQWQLSSVSCEQRQLQVVNGASAETPPY